MSDHTESSADSARTNRLAGESSPYLLLHQHNPVDWYPWGEEALRKAREEDRPIFLSVGYSTCYWCHVMERESFSEPGIARRMNEHFVNVKVDREERPDVDEIYMVATQILAGQGGWPNSVFLTPELKPFYAGTYFPPDERHGRPGFPAVLAGLAEAWRNRRDEVEMQADEMAQAMRRALEERVAPGDAPPQPGAAVGAYRGLEQTYDSEHGGFGNAPKFPTPANLYLLSELVGERGAEDRAPRAAEMLATTLDRMARGGIYDQLGGGFHRYSTDARWLVPHFEKMLYDNGTLLELYALEHERTGSPQAERIVRETARFLQREMTLPDGSFASAIDAETAGREGAFYVWTGDELREVLGEEDFAFLAPIYGFGDDPFFRDPHAPEAEPAYVLHLPAPVEEEAARRRTTPEELLAEIRPLRRRLFEARAERERPLTDDKVLADWNGLAIRGLAVAGRVLADGEILGQARRAADRVLETMRPGGGPLLHAVRGGEGTIAAYLSDYAYLVRGLLGLHDALEGAEGEPYLEAAVELAREQQERLAHPDGGFYNAEDRPDLLFRSQEIFDGATPAANGVAALNLLDLGERTGDGRWRQRAERALAAFAPVIEQAPEAVRMLAVASRRFHREAGSVPGGAEPEARPAAVDPVRSQAEAAVEHDLRLGEPDGEGVRPFRLRLAIAEGWHLQPGPDAGEGAAEGPLAGARPTRLEAEGAELLDLEYPAPTPWVPPAGGEEHPVYTGQVELTGRLRGGGQLVLAYQPCAADRCLEPVRRTIPVGP